MKKLLSAIALIALGIVLLISCFILLDTPTPKYELSTCTVQAGDTLWSLGSEYKAKNDDVRHWIDMVQEINGMNDATLYPGETLQIYIER